MTLADLVKMPIVPAARALLGWRLRTRFDGRITEVEIDEVEAYAGPDDPASHAFRGPTRRNRSLFERPGTLYVYRSYGIHWCANVVIGPTGRGNAILLRGGVPAEGRGIMEARRQTTSHLTDGPGKLTEALGITGVCDGSSLFSGPVRLRPRSTGSLEVTATTRIGITKAADRPWRFVVTQ
jgi:DNA-3-methyladenine glycosylase